MITFYWCFCKSFFAHCFEQQVFSRLDKRRISILMSLLVNIVENDVKCETWIGHISRMKADIEIYSYERRLQDCRLFVDLFLHFTTHWTWSALTYWPLIPRGIIKNQIRTRAYTRRNNCQPIFSKPFPILPTSHFTKTSISPQSVQ